MLCSTKGESEQETLSPPKNQIKNETMKTNNEKTLSTRCSYCEKEFHGSNSFRDSAEHILKNHLPTQIEFENIQDCTFSVFMYEK